MNNTHFILNDSQKKKRGRPKGSKNRPKQCSEMQCPPKERIQKEQLKLIPKKGTRKCQSETFFSIKPRSGGKCYYQTEITVDYTPHKELEQERLSIVPKLNTDNKPHIPGFIMEMDKNYYQKHDQRYREDHQNKISDYTKPKSMLYQPKPGKRHNYCCVCKQSYEDYLDEATKNHTIRMIFLNSLRIQVLNMIQVVDRTQNMTKLLSFSLKRIHLKKTKMIVKSFPQTPLRLKNVSSCNQIGQRGSSAFPSICQFENTKIRKDKNMCDNKQSRNGLFMTNGNMYRPAYMQHIQELQGVRNGLFLGAKTKSVGGTSGDGGMCNNYNFELGPLSLQGSQMNTASSLNMSAAGNKLPSLQQQQYGGQPYFLNFSLPMNPSGDGDMLLRDHANKQTCMQSMPNNLKGSLNNSAYLKSGSNCSGSLNGKRKPEQNTFYSEGMENIRKQQSGQNSNLHSKKIIDLTEEGVPESTKLTSFATQNQQNLLQQQIQQNFIGQQNQQTPFCQQNQQTPFGQQNQQTPFGQQNQQNSYGQQNQQTSFGQQNQQIQFTQQTQQNILAQQNQSALLAQQNPTPIHLANPNAYIRCAPAQYVV